MDGMILRLLIATLAGLTATVIAAASALALAHAFALGIDFFAFAAVVGAPGIGAYSLSKLFALQPNRRPDVNSN